MKADIIRSVLEGHLATWSAPSGSGVTIVYENTVASKKTPVINTELLLGRVFQHTIGGQEERATGFYILHVQVEKNTGSKLAFELADSLAEHFRNKSFQQSGHTIRSYSTTPRSMGKNEATFVVDAMVELIIDSVAS